MGPLSSAGSLLSDWGAEVSSVVGTVVLGLLGVVGSNRTRSKNNKRKLNGDPDDPNNEGVLQMAKDTREKVERIDEKMDDFRRETEREHEQVMDQLADISDGQGEE